MFFDEFLSWLKEKFNTSHPSVVATMGVFVFILCACIFCGVVYIFQNHVKIYAFILFLLAGFNLWVVFFSGTKEHQDKTNCCDCSVRKHFHRNQKK